MTKLDRIKKYAETLGKASKWANSGDQITSIESIQNEESKSEYIYEFYCLMRILDDLANKYDIEITNNTAINVFPKAPASKKNYPYFLVKEKGTGKLLFEVCTGVDIKGLADETSAPDISFQLPQDHLLPTHQEVFMIFDAKFKHKLTAKVSDLEFYKVAGMVKNLACEDADKNAIMDFFSLAKLKGNCILTNANSYKSNHSHHNLFNIKEVEKFDEGVDFNVIG